MLNWDVCLSFTRGLGDSPSNLTRSVTPFEPESSLFLHNDLCACIKKEGCQHITSEVTGESIAVQ